MIEETKRTTKEMVARDTMLHMDLNHNFALILERLRQLEIKVTMLERELNKKK